MDALIRTGYLEEALKKLNLPCVPKLHPSLPNKSTLMQLNCALPHVPRYPLPLSPPIRTTYTQEDLSRTSHGALESSGLDGASLRGRNIENGRVAGMKRRAPSNNSDGSESPSHANSKQRRT